MFNTIKKDKRRRLLFNKFEMQRLQSKVVLQDNTLNKEINSFFHKKVLDSNNKKEMTVENVNAIDLSPLRTIWPRKVLKNFPRNSSKSRVQNRCIESGRARAVLRFCKLSRICLREKASRGEIPGLQKASW